MSEIAKQILYKHATENNDGFTPGQVGWIEKAMEEYLSVNSVMIAKYHAVGLGGMSQESFNNPFTKKMLRLVYEASLKDIESGSIEKSVIEYDKIMKL